MQEQHARELAEQKAADEERFRKMDEEHRIREAALESRIRELEDARNNDGHGLGTPDKGLQGHFKTMEEAEAAYLNEKRKNDDLNRLRFSQSTESKYAGRTVVDADAADMKGEDAPDSTYHTSAERLSVILTIVRSALMNSLNVYQYIVYCLKTIRSYKGDLADLLTNKWKPADTELMPVLA